MINNHKPFYTFIILSLLFLMLLCIGGCSSNMDRYPYVEIYSMTDGGNLCKVYHEEIGNDVKLIESSRSVDENGDITVTYKFSKS